LYAAGAVIAALFLIAVIPLRLSAKYDADGFALAVHAGPVSVVCIPSKKKKKIKARPKEKKAPARPPRRELARVLLEVIKKIPGEVNVDRLHVRYIAAGADDPFKAALSYGGGYALKGMIAAFLENTFRKVKDFEYESAVDFQAEENSVTASGQLSMRVWQAAAIAPKILVLLTKSKTDSRNISRKER
jgi:hypothetical protein